MSGAFSEGGLAVHKFDQIHADAIAALRRERIGFFVVLRGNRIYDEEPMEALTAFAARGSCPEELIDFLEMVKEFADRELLTLRALEAEM